LIHCTQEIQHNPLVTLSAAKGLRLLHIQMLSSAPNCHPERSEGSSVLPLLFCAICPTCLHAQAEICEKRRVIGIQVQGALAHYVRVPVKNLVRLPDNVSFPIRAIITDAVATPFHALKLVPLDALARSSASVTAK